MGLTVPLEGDHITRPIFDQLSWVGYETPEIEALLALVRSGDRILEAGVGLGVVSALAAKHFPDAKIRSYEANPMLIAPIQDLYRRNGLTTIDLRNEILVRGVAGDSHRTFYIHESFAESSLLEPEGGAASVVSVPTENFEHVLSEFAPDVLVIDIEGGEEELLCAVDLTEIRVLVLELHPKVVSRQGIKEIYDSCAAAGLYPRCDLSTGNVVAFEKVT
ncbi:FkbM family methyltransferase [Parasedimentitalea psychrophila]|uniref:FkbM family methyltransferase n=1 Tax=Parasedimentitalea psychrophila TaxID=2997337 RepID=A0A9Y2L1S0_9RHOB|nr:FkbM family methyltransferase [Parasedimentitalea psychrophila]WIY25977.1 FkbM family methyltransferase [Parasedimentitalea psychrophila]